MVCCDCVLAAAFGLPRLLVEGLNVDPCFNKPEWDAFAAPYPNAANGNGEDFGQDLITRRTVTDVVLSDMCAWRHVAKAGFAAGSAANMAALLAVSMMGDGSTITAGSCGDASMYIYSRTCCTGL
jgi:hypothetical protein